MDPSMSEEGMRTDQTCQICSCANSKRLHTLPDDSLVERSVGALNRRTGTVACRPLIVYNAHTSYTPAATAMMSSILRSCHGIGAASLTLQSVINGAINEQRSSTSYIS